jgi:hypothetical protein
MYSNLRSVYGAYAGRKYSKTAPFGGFSLDREVEVTVAEGTSRSKRKYVASEKYYAEGEVQVRFEEALDDARGFNNAIISEDTGCVDADLLVAKMRLAGGIHKEGLASMAADPESFVMPDSQIALLVGMLSTYYVTSYKETAGKSKVGPYDDGHVRIDMGKLFPPAPVNDDWVGEDEVTSSEWEPTMAHMPPEGGVMCCHRLSHAEFSIVMAHLGGRRRTTNLAFDIEMPQLVEEIQFVGQENSPTRMPISEMTSKLVLRALNKYVDVNRLHGAFESALAMMHQTALSPVPDTAEGMAWVLRKRELVLPRFTATRGTYGMLLREKPYGLGSGVSTTWKWWIQNGLSTVVASAPYNALSLWGRYFVEAGFYDEDSGVHKLGHLTFAENPGAAYYSYAALVTGADTYCAVPIGFGLRYDDWDEDREVDILLAATLADVTSYNLVSSGGSTKLRVKQLPAPASMIHVIGKMPSDGMFANLSDRFTVNFTSKRGGWVFPNMVNAWGFAMATRWLGWDALMSYAGEERVANWAPNTSSIAAMPFERDGEDIETVRLISVTRRKKIWAQLPSLCDGTNTWEVQVEVSSAVGISAASGSRIASIGSFKPPKAAHDVQIVMPSALDMQSVPIVIQTRSRANFEEAGFHVISRQTPAHPSEPLTDAPEVIDPGEEAGGAAAPDDE